MRIALAALFVVVSAHVATARNPRCADEELAPISDIGKLDRLWVANAGDRTPPDAPSKVKVHIDVERWGSDEITVAGMFSADTAHVVVRLDDSTGSYFAVTTPAKRQICTKIPELASADVWVSVIAYDAAGNASRPFQTMTRVTYEPMNCVGPLIFIPVLFVAGLVFGLLRFVRIGSRSCAARMHEQRVERVHAAALLDATLRSTLKLFVLCALGTVALHCIDPSIYRSNFGVSMWAFAVGAIAVHVAIDLIDAWRMKSGLEEGFIIERRGNWLAVGGVQLPASRRAWQRATQLPTASATLRTRD